jgi:hypothetical protein
VGEIAEAYEVEIWDGATLKRTLTTTTTSALYTAAEQAGAAPQDAFAFNAESPALGTMTEFLAWKPESTDTASPKLRAIALYQDLLRFHASDADASARALIDLDRIEWAAGEATGDEADARAREQLAALLEAHAAVVRPVDAGLGVASDEGVMAKAPLVTQEALKAFTDRLVEAFAPEQVILFGSMARGAV